MFSGRGRGWCRTVGRSENRPDGDEGGEGGEGAVDLPQSRRSRGKGQEFRVGAEKEKSSFAARNGKFSPMAVVAGKDAGSS